MLLTILGFAVSNLINNGITEDIHYSNNNNYSLFIGTSIYIFEGTRLVIPIKDICQYPKDYSKILTITLVCVSWIFIGFGLLNYLSYGNVILQQAHLITKVLPDGNVLIQILFVLFILHLFILYPLTMHPVYSGIKKKIFGKWSKNIFKTLIVLLTIVFAVYYEENIDIIISIVGSLCWIPVAFIFPALFHYILVADSIWEKITDIFLIVFSAGLMIFTMGQFLY